MTYAKKISIGFDQLANALFNGFPDETLSARVYRLSEENGIHWPMKIVNALFFWQKNHCRGAYSAEQMRKHLPETYR